MTDLGSCPVCGRPRTTTLSGAPVSCCPRGVNVPKRPSEASSVLDAVTGLLDRGVLLAPRGLSRGGCFAVWVVMFLSCLLACAGVVAVLR